jgi:hypothetical protein
LKACYQARREAEAQRPDAERRVARLLAEKTRVAGIAAAVTEDRSLSEPQKNAAVRALLRHSALQGEQRAVTQ